MTYSHWIRLPNNLYLRLLAIPLLMLALAAEADHYPGHAKLEWGVGLVQVSMPEYRGSSYRNDQLVPFPYVKYRGDKLIIDDGIEGRLFKTPDILLSISGNGSLPSSNKNSERSGMDNLDATLEFGPSLEIRLRSDDDSSIWLELPLRFAASIGRDIRTIGETFHPRLAWRWPAKQKENWKLRFAGGPLYADADYHGYFYNVDSSEVTANRAEYTADAGYSGMRLDFTYSRRIQEWWLGGFVRYDNLDQSVIEDSPLVTNNSSWTAGISLAYIISEH